MNSQISGRKNRDIISGMFVSAALAMILTQLVGTLAGMIDGIITSNFYGRDAYSAVSLSGPIVNTVILLTQFISTGVQILCAQYAGEGEREKADRVFTLSLIIGLVISVVFIAAGLLAPDLLAAVCGVTAAKRPELYPHMQEYLAGFLFGIPALVLIQIVSPLIVMDSGKKTVAVSALVLCGTDVAGDLLNALVFDGGNFGMGLATAVSYWVQLAVLLTHYRKGNSGYHLRLSGISLRECGAIAKYGSPTFVRKLSTILRDLFVNRMNLSVALTTAAVAARSIQNDLNVFMFALGVGIGKVLLTMSGMYYAADDRKALKRLYLYVVQFALLISAVVGGLLFLFAPQVVRIFTRDSEVLEYAVLSVRCMAVGLIFDTLATALMSYLQGIRNLKVVNYLNFCERFFIPVAVALVLGKLYGSKGILVSVAVGKFVLVLVMLVTLWIRNRSFPRRTEDFMFLPPDFGGREEDNFYARILTLEDVGTCAEAAERFCREKGYSGRTVQAVTLCAEELSRNIVQYGEPKGREKIPAELRIRAFEDKILLTLRDYCMAFDPVSYYKVHSSDADPSRCGLRIVLNLADNVSYINAFNSNNITVEIENRPEA